MGVSRFGGDGPFPNGGLWRFESLTRSVFVKRTGSAYLGRDPVWRLSLEEQDPQWWGREAAFYGSDLALAGWSDSCGPAECFAVDARSDEIDLWLEYVDTIPLPVSEYESAVQGLARWQVEHRQSDSPVLSRGWLAQHVSRRHLNNASTTKHDGWPTGWKDWTPLAMKSEAVGGLLYNAKGWLEAEGLYWMRPTQGLRDAWKWMLTPL
jgi:hypothetical protein